MLSYTFDLGLDWLDKRGLLLWKSARTFTFGTNILAGAEYDHHVSQLEYLVEN